MPTDMELKVSPTTNLDPKGVQLEPVFLVFYIMIVLRLIIGPCGNCRKLTCGVKLRALNFFAQCMVPSTIHSKSIKMHPKWIHNHEQSV